MRTVVDGIEHFVTERGAILQCDRCRDNYDNYDAGLKWKTAEDKAGMNELLDALGWVAVGDYHLCPSCVRG